MDTGMQPIGAAPFVDLGAVRTVTENGVEYTYRRQASAVRATISASMAGDDGYGPHFTTTTRCDDRFWGTVSVSGFCECVRAALAPLTRAVVPA